MWGNWLILTLAGLGVVLVLLAATVLSSPLLAILIAVVAAVVAIPIMSSRRARSEREAGLARGTGGAPASGEGGEVGAGTVPAEHRARERRSGRITKGIWGERREA
jgi:uncharacterized protein (DUF58 family)